MVGFLGVGAVGGVESAAGLLHGIPTRAGWPLALLAILLVAPIVRADDPARRPNVVFILADDKGYQAMQAWQEPTESRRKWRVSRGSGPAPNCREFRAFQEN